jgi:SulP family sulfate permease
LTAPAAPASRPTLTETGRDFAAALVVTLSAISFYVSSASLLFQGALAPYLPGAIGAAMLGGGLLALIGAWRCALPLASVGPEPATVPVLAAMTAGIAATVSGPALLPTTVMALTVTGLCIGALWWVAGRRGWGELMRYIPYPVIGGFLGSIGWLIFTGGLGVSMGQSFTLARAAEWLGGGAHGADARLWVGLAIGVVIWQVTLRVTHPLTLPVLLAAGVALIHAGLALAGIGLEAARAGGWLLAAFSRTEPPLPWSPQLLALVQWDAIVQQAPLIASAMIVATIGLLLSDTSLEVAWDQDADINRDLRGLGQGNLLAVAAGGLVGGISISRSVLNRAAGGATRLSGAFKGVAVLGAMAWGGGLIALVPRPLLGGMLVYLGLGMLKAWLLDSRRRLPATEYLIVLLMVGLTATLGFLPAVCVGVLACCVDFAAASARLAPVRRLVPRSAWPAKAERGAEETQVLQRAGERLHIVELQGVLFFGSATRLAAQVEPLLARKAAAAAESPAQEAANLSSAATPVAEGASPPPASAATPERLLFDFRHVRGLDTSAAQSLARLFKAARRVGMGVDLCGLAPEIRRTVEAGGAAAAAAGNVFADVDAAVGAWDEAVLAQAVAQPAPPGELPATLLPHFEPVQLGAGDVLFRRGEGSDALYLVRTGRLEIVAPGADGREVLLRTAFPGSAVGEMGLLRDVPRSATARAAEPTSLWRLTRERMQLLARDEPALEAALYRRFLVQMAGRVEQLGQQANALAR